MPTGSLPIEGKALFEKVYDKALKGSCKGDKECAARTAWSAVKGAGWSKDDSGKWHKKAVYAEFSLAISRASYDKATNRMNWRAVASDTDEDFFKDNMTLSLFNDFINRIQQGEAPPERYKSEFWSGGLPYMSLSHYPDMNGKAVPGTVENVYIDGNRLKSTGYFDDTPLGRACFKSVCNDLYGEDEPNPEGKVRISIAFLDYQHKHKSNGYLFTRGNPDEPICMECIREFLEDGGDGKEFLKGLLIHEALTRVPANQRTEIATEVDKSMAIKTRKDDALSIVGEDDEAKSIVDEIAEAAEMVGKSELVIKSETEEDGEEVITEVPDTDEVIPTEEDKSVVEKDGGYAEAAPYRPFGGSTSLKDAKAYIEAGKESMRISDLWYAFQSVVENISNDENIQNKAEALTKATEEFKNMLSDKSATIYNSFITLSMANKVESVEPVAHPLDGVFAELRTAYNQAVAVDGSVDDKLMALQPSFAAVVANIQEQVRSTVQTDEPEITENRGTVDDVVGAVMQKLSPALAEMKAMIQGLQAPVQPKEGQQQDIQALVNRRSLLPTSNPVQPNLQNQKPVVKSGASISDIVNRTT